MKIDDLKQPESNQVCGNEWIISLPRTRIHTLDELLEYCKVDTSIWEVERFVANKWEVGSKNEDGDVTVTPLFQVKATLKKRVEIADARKEIEDLKALAFEFAPLPPPVIRPNNPSGNMLEINIPDLHAGKLAWEPETGANYDTRIACALFNEALDSLISRVNSYSFDEILFVVGNDLLNSDNAEGTTTSGTPVSNDSRYPKTFTAVRNMKIEAIEKMRAIAPVKVIMVPGNHDTLSMWHLGDSLECYFHKYEDVTIDNAPRIRKYHRFGDVMLLLTHGHKAKFKSYPMLMATEEREMFGATKFHEIHTGHKHKTLVDEEFGVRTRILSALCAPDDYHVDNGYVGNLRSAEAFVWNKCEGLIGTAIFTARDE